MNVRDSNFLRFAAPTSALVLSAEGNPPDDGGAGGGGGRDGDDAPKYVTPQQLANALRKAKSDITQGLSSTVEEKLSSLGESLGEQLMAKIAASGQSKAPEGGAGDPPVSPEMEAMAARLEAAERQVKTEREARLAQERARKEERDRGRHKDERDALSKALRAGGVRDAQIPALAAYLHAEQKALGRDDGDRIVWNNTGEDRDLEPHYALEKGVAKFLASDAGREWLPPRQVQGSGAKPESGRRPGAAQATGLDAVGEQLGNAGLA